MVPIVFWGLHKAAKGSILGLSPKMQPPESRWVTGTNQQKLIVNQTAEAPGAEGSKQPSSNTLCRVVTELEERRPEGKCFFLTTPLMGDPFLTQWSAAASLLEAKARCGGAARRDLCGGVRRNSHSDRDQNPLVTHRNKWQYVFMVKQGLQDEIIARLSTKKPLKVILFGSQAYGQPGEESDVDLLVVLDKEGIPRSYKEKTENFIEVSRLLRHLNKRVAMDLVVMTRTQWEHFIEMDSGFFREIRDKGLPLI